jgi:hypothetical protein
MGSKSEHIVCCYQKLLSGQSNLQSYGFLKQTTGHLVTQKNKSQANTPATDIKMDHASLCTDLDLPLSAIPHLNNKHTPPLAISHVSNKSAASLPPGSMTPDVVI